MSWKRFTNPEFFGRMGKALLVPLLDRFASDFTKEGIELPAADMEEKEYCKKLADLGTKQGFPPKMSDVLYGIVALGDDEGKVRIQAAAARLPKPVEFTHDDTCEMCALKLYLAAPEEFEKRVHEAQVLAKSAFQVFGSAVVRPAGSGFPAPTTEQLRLLKADVDEWVAQTYRGQERATQIEAYECGGEHLLLIRIGDTNARHAVVEGDGFSYQHFRPAKDLILTYAPSRDELRIHGKGTKKIRMARESFGRRFFGDPDRFSVRDPFTLKPLIRDGEAALAVEDGWGIKKIVLTELIQDTDGDPGVTLRFKGPDLFEFAEREKTRLFWKGFKVAAAGFNVWFAGQTEPRQFFLREGNGLRQVQNSDADALYRWMTEKGFRKQKAEEAADDEPVDQN